MLNSRKTWLAFVLFEALCLMIAIMVTSEFKQIGGETNIGVFIGTLAGGVLLWWSGIFLIDAVIDSIRR